LIIIQIYSPVLPALNATISFTPKNPKIFYTGKKENKTDDIAEMGIFVGATQCIG
jgi:hypothetical protein